MSDDLRPRVRAAISAEATLRGLSGPDHIETVTGPLDAFADAVMAVLDEEMPRLHRLWLQAQADGHGGLVDLVARDAEAHDDAHR